MRITAARTASVTEELANRKVPNDARPTGTRAVVRCSAGEIPGTLMPSAKSVSVVAARTADARTFRVLSTMYGKGFDIPKGSASERAAVRAVHISLQPRGR